MFRHVQFIQRENRELKAMVATYGERIDKRDQIKLQLTCKDDELKKLKGDDHDKDPGAAGCGDQQRSSNAS